MTAIKRRVKTSTRPLLRAVSAYRERAAMLIMIGALWFCRVASVEGQRAFLCDINLFFLQGALKGPESQILRSASFKSQGIFRFIRHICTHEIIIIQIYSFQALKTDILMKIHSSKL